jgi:polar amino acid transport system substrate-binding protein
MYILCTPCTTQAEQQIQINIVSDEWQGFVTQEGTGYYLDLLRLVFPSPRYKLNITIYPYSRAIHKVQSNSADIVLGIWANEHPTNLLSTYPVETDILDALMRSTHPAITGPESFDQLRVLAQTGYGLDELLHTPFSYEERVELSNMIKMVKSNRADVLIGYHFEIEAVVQELGLQRQLVIIKHVLTEHAYFGFCSTEKCIKLKGLFDESFLDLHQRGIIKKLLMDNDQSPSAEPKLRPSP